METIELTGSEKQIKWANEIRAKFLADLDTYVAETVSRAGGAISIGKADTEIVGDISDIFARFRDRLASQGQAAWWIDQRQGSFFSPKLMFADDAEAKTALAAARTAFAARH